MICEGLSGMSAQNSGVRSLSAFGDGGACEIDHQTSELI